MKYDDVFNRPDDEAANERGSAGRFAKRAYRSANKPGRMANVLPVQPHDALSPLLQPRTRYSDLSLHWRTRLLGIATTAGLFGLITGLALFTWHAAYRTAPISEPLVVTLQPLASPADPVEEVPEGPRQKEQKEQKPVKQNHAPPPKITTHDLTPVALPSTPSVSAAKATDPVPETTAPKSMPAPPAQRASNDEKVTWESRLLAHLGKYRRYPEAARARHEEGVAYVTFRMNRAGAVLSAEIIRSSGSGQLDRAALATLKRAQPLPAIPDDKPDPLELSVPVEFFLQR